MKIKLPTGRYVVAVSGGVDSVVLLNMLSNLPNVDAVIAHFNHGIRVDADEDAKLVTLLANKYDLPLEIGRAKLGKNASEEKARAARYEFLVAVKKKHQAKAIITAHHQDDLIETAIINLLRGTGRRGLTALAQNPDVMRPLLNTPKSELIKYAKKHHLKWREDVTNQDSRYLRNYIRLNLTPKLTDKQRQKFLLKINQLNSLNPVLDKEIATLLQSHLEDNKIKRQKFISLPSEIAAEVLATYLRANNIQSYDKKSLERLTVAIKTAKPGTKHNIVGQNFMVITRTFAHLNQGVD